MDRTHVPCPAVSQVKWSSSTGSGQVLPSSGREFLQLLFKIWKLKSRWCVYVMACWEFFLSKTQFWCRAYIIRTKNVLLRTKFQLNFHVQNVIYGSNQEKELLQSRAENLSELWDASSKLSPSYKSWGSCMLLCTEMQHIPFPHATSAVVGSFFWAKKWHRVL